MNHQVDQKSTVAEMRTNKAENAYTHITVVDGEPVRIVSQSAPNRAPGWFTVEGSRGQFIAHERDLALITKPEPLRERFEERRPRRGRDDN